MLPRCQVVGGRSRVVNISELFNGYSVVRSLLGLHPDSGRSLGFI